MKQEKAKILFDLYLQGKSDQDQEKILMDYLADPAHADSEFYEVMEKNWIAQTSETNYGAEAIQSFAKIRSRIEKPVSRILPTQQLFRYAAAIMIFISVGFAWYIMQHQTPLQQPLSSYFTKTTQKGERVKLILPDSSVVYLGAESKLSWPSRFVKGKYRNIHLDGEAFFEVKRDTSSPFIVHSGAMQTRVLGTSFNICAYPKDGTFSVAVRTGKVKVSENSKGTLKELSLLTPGMKLYYQVKENQFSLQREQISDVNAWINNRFVFKNVSLHNLLKTLERHYNVHFNVQGSRFNQCRYNATFSNKVIADVMEEIRMMSGKRLNYKINTENGIITVWGEGCQ